MSPKLLESRKPQPLTPTTLFIHHHAAATMNSLRIARTALSARSVAFRAATPLRRSYADVAPDKIKLTLALPHQAIYKSQDV